MSKIVHTELVSCPDGNIALRADVLRLVAWNSKPSAEAVDLSFKRSMSRMCLRKVD